MRYGPEHKRGTRRRVLSAAASAMRAQGPHRITVAGVMASAGLTHGGFYEHFDSRDDLVAATIAEMFAGALARLEGFVGSARPREALRSYVAWYLSPEHRDAREEGCPLAALAGDFTRLSAAARSRASEGHSRVLRRLREVLESAGHHDAEPLAHSVLAEMLGALASARALGTGPGSDAALAASRAHLLHRVGSDAVA